MNRVWSIFILVGSLFLASCATQQARRLDSQSAPVFMHSTWQEQGVLAYRAGKKGFSASYIWQNSKDHYTVQIIAPLGTWRAKLWVTANGAALSTSDGKILRARDPLSLMEENLNWSIPATYLHYWLWGIPEPHTPFQARKNAQNDITHLDQGGWSIDYPSYENFSLARLPEKIVLSQGEKKITLVVQNFNAG